MKAKGKSCRRGKSTAKCNGAAGRSISKKRTSESSCFSNLPKESGRLSASFYAKR